MKIRPLGLLFLSFTICLSSCGAGTSKSALKFIPGIPGVTPIQVDPNSENDLQYLAIKKKLFDTSCVKCHNPESAIIKKRLDLTKIELILKNYDDIIYRMTDAFDVDDEYMPPKGGAVAPEIIKEFKDWKSDAQFANLQKNLFEVSCLKCHDSSQSKHINLTSKAIVIEKFDDIIYKMTTAFDFDDEPMPPVGKGEKISPELIKELQKWKAKI